MVHLVCSTLCTAIKRRGNFTKDDLLLTAQEAADILKVSKYTLYELVKRKQIPAQRIGRQLRVNKEDLNMYLKGNSVKKANRSSEKAENDDVLDNNLAGVHFVGSHEPIIELLAEFLKHGSKSIKLTTSFTGSMEGMYALFKGSADIAGVHLWDSTTDDYNSPFLKYVLPGEKVKIINLVQRVQGWIVQPGNPLSLGCFADITKKGLRFVNRQKGSGTRLRIDSYLLQSGISSSSIKGYELEENTHFGVACKVASREADAGIGLQSAAYRMGMDFVPLFKERYDILCLEEKTKTIEWQQLLHTLNSEAFQNAIKRQIGYDVTLTGHEIDNTLK